jgi:prephenate dehydratase
MYLRRTWPDTEIKEWADTADAVRAIKDGELPRTAAAIASKGAAELYKMEIVEEGIQDLKFNFTTFLAVRKR